MGHVMQPVIANLYAAKEGVYLKDLEGVTVWHKEHAFMGSHFDYLRDDGSNVLVECKNFHPARKKEFGDDGSDDVPMDCLIQCVHEAVVWGTNRVDLAVLFGGQQFRIYPLTIRQETIDMVIAREQAFWQMVIERKAPPPVTTEETRALFPTDKGSTSIATTDCLEAFHHLVQVQDQIKMLEGVEDKLKTTIQAAMGEHSILATTQGEVLATWKQGKPVRRVDVDALKAADLYMGYSKESEAPRRFLLKK
jgi:predicted phage-related endonuclease